MPESVTETETKYDAPADLELPALADLPGVASVGGPAEQELTAEYFDTEDLHLLQAGITLRRRTGGQDAGWHLKLPSGPDTRTEVRLPLGRAVRRVPGELADLVRARARGRPLQPVATLTTRRRVTTLFDRAGGSLAEVADDRVSGLRRGDKAPGVRWREVEVELTGGSRGLLVAADKLLRDTGLRPAERTAKVEMVLGSSRAAKERARGTDKAEQPAGSAGRSAAALEVIIAYLRRQADTLVVLDPLVRRGEPDTLHQMRVATRRLRSTLRTFVTVLPRAETTKVADELQWLGGVLGSARDAEVQAERMQRQLRSIDDEQLAARVREHFTTTSTRTQARVRRALNSGRYYALLDALDALTTDPPLGEDARAMAGLVLPAAVRSSFRKARRRMREAQRAGSAEDRDVALHQARKAAKQARYAAEAAAAVAGRDAARFASRMQKVQAALGDHQDTVVGRQLARELASQAEQAGESAFGYGVIYAREEAEGERLRAQARRAWKRAARRRYRGWMSG